jgi:hypothetical protein
METQIDTWPGPGPSLPTTALLGLLSSPSLRTNPVVLGVVVLLLTLRILESQHTASFLNYSNNTRNVTNTKLRS